MLARVDGEATLSRVADALGADKLDDALTALVAAWRVRPDPAIAERIERLGAHLAARAPKIERRTKAAIEEEYLARAGKGLAGELDVLLAVPWPAQWRDALARVRALKGHGRDPRIAAALITLSEQPPYDSQASIGLWVEVWRMLVLVADPRTVPRFDALVPALEKKWWGYRHAYGREIGGDALREACARPLPAPSDDDRAVLAAVDAALGPAAASARADPSSEEALLADVLARPDDDAPRRAFARWLTDRNEPWGELIERSLEPGARDDRRVATLAKKVGDRVLGPLAPHVESTGIELERGFLSACIVKVGHAYAQRSEASPWWATVRRIVLEETGRTRVPVRSVEVAAFLRHPVMRSLRSVHGLGDRALGALAEGGPLPWDELSVCAWDAMPDPPPALSLPALRRLGLVLGAPAAQPTPMPRTWLEHPSWSGVRELHVSGPPQMDVWLPWLLHEGRQLERLVLVGARSRATCLPEGWWLELEPDGYGRARMRARALAGTKLHDSFVHGLERAPAGALVEIVVEPTTVLTKSQALRDEVGRLRHVVPPDVVLRLP